MIIECKHCKASVDGPTNVCPNCKKNPNLAPIGGATITIVGALALLIVLAAGFVVLRGEGCLGRAHGDEDPCAKEKAAASKSKATPTDIRQLQECRRRQRAGAGPLNRTADGGVK